MAKCRALTKPAVKRLTLLAEGLTGVLQQLRCSSSTAARRHTLVVTVDVDVMITPPHPSTPSKESSAPWAAAAAGNDAGSPWWRPTWNDSATSTRRTTLLKRVLRRRCWWWRPWQLPLIPAAVDSTSSRSRLTIENATVEFSRTTAIHCKLLVRRCQMPRQQ